MKGKYFFTSLTRISDLSEAPFEVRQRPRQDWATGDYVVGRVLPGVSQSSLLELDSGRATSVVEGDLVVGAFGNRFATLEMTGDWREIDDSGEMVAMTGAGLFGAVQSLSPYCPSPIPLVYDGHVFVDGRPVGMRDYVEAGPASDFDIPMILLVGSSMSAGKTTSAKIIIRQLTQMGLRVIGAKLTGAGRYRDILGMSDAGAEQIFDFVDVGLPSTVCPEQEYRQSLRQLLSMMARSGADVVVAEAGASPLEPYNGAVATDEIERHVRCMVLCASDPYSVLGILDAFGKKADFVTGLATSTEAGVALIERLSNLKALNLLDKAARPELEAILRRSLALAPETEGRRASLAG